MRVLLLTQYFPPEIGATQTRLHTFAVGLARRGHDVHVVCEVPNHPQGVVHEEFRRRAVVRRRMDGFSVTYVWVLTSPTKTSGGRLAFYGSYTALASVVGAAVRRPDVVLASSPPLPVGVVAAAVARRHRIPWVLDVRDLWPDAAVAMGELGNERAIQVARRLERWLYRDADAITAVTVPFVDKIAAQTAPGKQIELVPNGTTRFWVEGADVHPDRAAALGVEAATFVWAFAGNVGAAQGLEPAVDAARELGPGFCLLVIGDGPAKSHLQQLAADLPDDQVRFLAQMPQAEVLPKLRASDALLVPLAPDPILADFVPSKLFDFCALARPVVVSAAGEPQRLAGAHGAALSVEPGSGTALAAAITRLRDDPAERAHLALAARAFGRANLREGHLARLEHVLQGVATRGRRG